MTTVTRNQLDGDIKSVVAINMMITVEGGEEGVVILLMRSLLDVIKEGVGICCDQVQSESDVYMRV